MAGAWGEEGLGAEVGKCGQRRCVGGPIVEVDWRFRAQAVEMTPGT